MLIVYVYVCVSAFRKAVFLLTQSVDAVWQGQSFRSVKCDAYFFVFVIAYSVHSSF